MVACVRTIKIGLCGFAIAISRYPQLFPVVEVQQTFYQPPAEAIMRCWRESVGADFEFTIKAWQLITHTAASPTYRRLKRTLSPREGPQAGAFRNSALVDEGWRITASCAALLGASSILFQCPASFLPTDENVANLTSFFTRIDRPSGVRLLWEPRGPWSSEMVASVCVAQGLTHVVDPFANQTVTSGFSYYRLHGITGSRHIYSDEELLHLREMLPTTGQTYVMFNNIPRADDAQRFGRLLGEGLCPDSDGRCRSQI